MSKIMLVDGNSIINRAFYAIPMLTNKNGEHTNAVYGFLNILFKFIDEETPSHIAVTFDLSAPTFRHKSFEAYKGTRKGMPDELRTQIPLLKALLRSMNIAIYELEGYEADDLLGTLAVKYEKSGFDVILVSGDRDLLQIASDKIQIRIPKTKAGKTEVENYFATDVAEQLGVTPAEYIDVKALMGDTSDNIPGVPGIGEKTAFKIIQQYHSLENALKNAENILPKKASQNLIEFKELALLSKELATINTDAPVEVEPSKTQISQETIFNNTAREEFKRLEFKSLLSRFENSTEVQAAVAFEYKVLQNETEIDSFFQQIGQQDLAAYKLIYVFDTFLGISFHSLGTGSVFLPFDKDWTNELLARCNAFFTSQVKKITLDLKKDLVLLNRYGISVEYAIFDVMLAGYILNASKDKYEYNDIALDFMNEVYPSFDDFFGKGKLKKELDLIAQEEIAGFSARQAEVIFRAYGIMNDQIIRNNQEELYYGIELPLVYVLKDMEIHGIRVDRDALIAYGANLDHHIDRLTNEIYLLAGEEFNINSPKQLGVILFEKLGLKGGKKTKTGYSTAAEVLEKLSEEHPIIRHIMQYRTYTKLKSTYVDGLLAVYDDKTGKIYSTFNQAVTTTGRISSTEPNLQNIPIRLELGRELRKIFIPSDDSFEFADADYSQIELRILAHMANDKTFIKAFKQGQDIHKLTASQVFKIPFDQVTATQRGNAKAVNFGIVYGISAFSLSQDLAITQKEASRYIDGYFEKYPNVKKYLDKTIEQTRADGFASTIYNRRRNVPEIHSENFIQRSFGERVAMNMPVQGSAADIIKIAMVRVYQRLKREGLQSRIILQVHDELLLDVKKEEREKVTVLLKEEMENAASLSVPLEVDVKTGANWFEAH